MTTHLNAHQGIHRVISKPHVCLICNMGFTKSSKLTEHLANQHNSYTSANVPATTLELPVDTVINKLPISQKQKDSPSLPVTNAAPSHNKKSVIQIKKETLSDPI